MPARGQGKKKTPPRVFFFLLRPRRKAREGEAPLGAGTGPEQKKKWPRAGAQRGFSFPCLSPGPEQKKKTPWVVFFFCSGPVPAPNGASPSLAFRRGRSKKKKKHPGWCFFFCSGPVPAPNRASLSLAFRRGRSKKKNTLGGVFFFALAPCRHGAAPSPAFPRGRSKKKTPWVVFFFCSGPAERSRRPTERNKKKKHLAQPGPTAKSFLETNDAGHEQKGATKKKKKLARFGPVDKLNPKRPELPKPLNHPKPLKP